MKKDRTKKRLKLPTTILIVIASLIIGITIRLFVFEMVKVDGLSMYPTLNNRQHLLILKSFYNINREDIVIFKSHDVNDSLYVKRIIGLPNEHLEIKDSKIFINGEEIKEDYIPTYVETIGDIDITIPEEEYFLLGDNRGQSKDSRIIGTVKEEDILGEVKLKLF